MTLIQRPWDPAMALCSVNTLSPNVGRDIAVDCTIHSLVTLGFLPLDKGEALSKQINASVSKTMPTNLINYLGNDLQKNVYMNAITSLEDAKTKLLDELQIGNATLIGYQRTDNTSHTILIYKPNDTTLMCVDVQQRVDFPFNELIRRENHKIIGIILFSEEDIDKNGKAPMDVANADDYLVGGKTKKQKNKKTKGKRKKGRRNKTKNKYKK
jgi:hypothetical protein